MNTKLNTCKQRLDYMDIFRSMGIILMIMGHIGFGEKFDYFIHAFHMPMFFFISGFLYKKKDISVGQLIRKKAVSLLIPYAVFGLAHYLINCLKDGFTVKPLIHLLTVNTNGLPIAGALWFLTSLFFTDIIYFILDKLNMKYLIIPLVLIGHFADRVLPYALPWGLSAAFVGLGLYWLGNMAKQYEEKIKFLLNIQWYWCLLFGAITAVLIFLNGYINMRIGTYAIIPLFWINVLMSIFVGISLSKIIYSFIGNSFLGKCLISVGQNSVVYVCLNQLVILFFLHM